MPELEQKSFQKRQVAYKVRISDVLKGSFVRDEFSAGYIKLEKNHVSRVNIIATVVYKLADVGYSNVVIDDGTGRIQLRSFDNISIFSKIDVGDFVLLIGRVREFNNEKYIMPEIFKKLKYPEWANVRKLELDKSDYLVDETKNNENLAGDAIQNSDEDVYLLVKKLDNGSGVSIEDIIKNSNNSNVEDIINRLLENGDIFEISPGKLKVLE